MTTADTSEGAPVTSPTQMEAGETGQSQETHTESPTTVPSSQPEQGNKPGGHWSQNEVYEIPHK